jgi:hypothetical protein
MSSGINDYYVGACDVWCDDCGREVEVDGISSGMQAIGGGEFLSACCPECGRVLEWIG